MRKSRRGNSGVSKAATRSGKPAQEPRSKASPDKAKKGTESDGKALKTKPSKAAVEPRLAIFKGDIAHFADGTDRDAVEVFSCVAHQGSASFIR
jgi:hypothetical protein